jgi:hypothetical protein
MEYLVKVLQYFVKLVLDRSEVGAQPREPMNGHNAQTWIILPKSLKIHAQSPKHFSLKTPNIHAQSPNILPKTGR